MFLIRARCEGVHAAAVKEGIYARLLRAAQAASQLAPAQGGQAFFESFPALGHTNRVSVGHLILCAFKTCQTQS